MITFLLGRTEVAARVPPRSVRRAGEQVSLMLDPATLHVFDRASGQRQ
jgi:hypothetical protein